MLNISRSKGNQTMELWQLIEYNIRNIFLEKSYANCGEKTIPRLFSKKSKLTISLDQLPKVLYSFFLLYGKLRAIKIYLLSKLSFRPIAFTSYKAFFLKKRKVWDYPLCLIFFFLYSIY